MSKPVRIIKTRVGYFGFGWRVRFYYPDGSWDVAAFDTRAEARDFAGRLRVAFR